MVTNPEIERFLADPVNYFGHSLDKIMGLAPSAVNELQIEGLRRRFAQFRGRLPMLDKLADLQGIHAIQALDLLSLQSMTCNVSAQAAVAGSCR